MTSSRRAALYLRSSKDRSDVSIDAQRRELQKFAADRSLLIVREYVDVVESAKDEHRPAFQQLLRDMKGTGREWSVLLMLDTSRLSRRRYMAQVFKHEAKKQGVEILYSKVPDVDQITRVVLEAVFEAFDEVHSLMSREKGIAGMAENVRRGFRAGGRAPRGYRLRHVATEVYRDGAPVTKSVLEPSEEAPLVARYLKARAAGERRTLLKRQLNLAWQSSTLVGMEWNALTYAGHTVWNMRNEFEHGGYKGSVKRRPREDWIIQRNTHQALITDEEAEAILHQLNTNPYKNRRRGVKYLLSGLLVTPDGESWHGNGGGRYRVKGSRANVSQEALETAVLEKVKEDWQEPAFAADLAQEARNYVEAHPDDPAAECRSRMTEITARISRMMTLAAGLADPAPALREIDALERQRKALVEEIERLEGEYAAADMLRGIDAKRVKRILGELVEEMLGMDREGLKDFLAGVVERVELHPDTLTCRIHYKIGVRDKRASPRRGTAIPILRAVSRLAIPRRRAA